MVKWCNPNVASISSWRLECLEVIGVNDSIDRIYEAYTLDATHQVKVPLNIRLGAEDGHHLLKIAASSDEQYAKLFKDADDYIAVSMVVVLQQYQGQGYMKKLLTPAFREAEKRNCSCILDTDSPEKVVKYEHCGMKKVAEKQVGHGVTLYTMAYKK